jgi:acetyl-CoA carboxylase biotin carboxyl carrier protein
MPRNGGTKSGARKAAKGRGVEADANAAEEAARSNGHATGAAELLVDLEFLRGLIEAVDGSGIDNVEIMRAGTRIRISKSPQPGRIVQARAAPGAASAHISTAASAASAPAAEAAPAAAPAPPATPMQEVKSPMVGTFFRAPAPEAPPYVENGSQVSKGQTLCILEAMKLMNELESEYDGVVREILVENGEPVEFGQVLFRIEPAGA